MPDDLRLDVETLRASSDVISDATTDAVADVDANTKGAPSVSTAAGDEVAADVAAHGLFVTFEGGDGAGKTTQIERAAAWLRELGREVVITREPGGTPLGVEIRRLLLHGDDVASRAEALLYAADRAHHVETLVRPALARGAVVLQDRYIDSSIAYQGAGRALAADDVESISRWATRGLTPDVTVLIDVSPEVARERRGARGAEDRLEREADDFHTRVREHFLRLAARDEARYLVLDAGRSRDDLTAAVRRTRRLLDLDGDPPRRRRQHETVPQPGGPSGHAGVHRDLRPVAGLARHRAQGQTRQPVTLEHALGGLGGVGDRAGVGHGEDGGEAAGRGGRGPGPHRLRVLATGLAQVRVQVDEPRQEGQPVGVDARGALPRGGLGPDGGDDAVPDEDVGGLATEHGCAGDQQVAHACPPSSGRPEASRW